MPKQPKEFSTVQKKFLAMLSLFCDPVPIDTTTQIVPLPPGELLELIDTVREKGWLRQQEGTCYSLVSPIPPELANALEKSLSRADWAEMLERLKALDQETQIRPITLVEIHRKAGLATKAAVLAHRAATESFQGGDTDMAHELLLKAVNCLEESAEEGNHETDHLLLRCALLFSETATRRRDQFDVALRLLQQVLPLAEKLGDTRRQAMVILHMGRILQHQHLMKDALEYLSRGIRLVEGLGDSDIMYQAAEFFGIYYYIQGLASNALGFFEKAIEARQRHDRRAANEILPVYLGNCAAFMGQFHRAIGILDAHWHRAMLQSDHATARLMRAALGNVLLMAGRRPQALEHLTDCVEEVENGNDLWAMVWSKRALAYSLYLEGQMAQSHSLMLQCLEEASRHGMPRPFYAFPWMLEVLFAYHHSGYAPIPNHHLDDELDSALHGINIHLRGTARRLRAKQIILGDGDIDQAVSLLEASMEEMKQVHDPVGLAKGHAEMAICCLRKGDRTEARDLALHAWETLSVFGSDHFPDQLKPLIESQKIVAGSRKDNKDFLKRLIATLETIVPNADRTSLLSELVSGIARFLEAERGALFLLEDKGKVHGPVFAAGYNLSRDMAESEPFRKSLMFVFKAFEEQKPVFKRDPDATSQKAILCLPMTTAGGTRGVLYLAESYGNDPFAAFSDQTLDAISQYATKYVDWVANYCRQMEEISLSTIKSASDDDSRAEGLKYSGPVMERFIKRVDQIAATGAAVLIMGESGVGKELVAQRIHARSPHCDMPFIPVNLASIPESLMESELFGHERGAFTGADRQKKGRMELAHKGTLFLDEIGEIPRSIQVKLLRVLQEKSFMRVGGVTVQHSDFRLITATNRDLVKEVAEGHFREDLYYRLNVVPLIVPPLRERNDISFLTNAFLEEFSRKYCCRSPFLNEEDYKRFEAYSWPGNVRELKNIVERAVISTLHGGQLEFSLSDGLSPRVSEGQLGSFIGNDFPSLDELERRYIKMVIEKTGGKIGGKGGAAELLGLNRTTLYSRMKKLGLS